VLQLKVKIWQFFKIQNLANLSSFYKKNFVHVIRSFMFLAKMKNVCHNKKMLLGPIQSFVGKYLINLKKIKFDIPYLITFCICVEMHKNITHFNNYESHPSSIFFIKIHAFHHLTPTISCAFLVVLAHQHFP